MLRDICTKPVVTVTAEAPISEAARLMRDKNVGAVVVVTGNRPGGIVTDRDIAMAVAAGGKPAGAPVAEIMRGDPAVIQEDRGVLDAAKLLAERGVRRLPVIDSQGRLTGIIALDDLLILLGTEMGHVASALSRELGRPAAVATR